jgi:uncharacterized membrane protein
MKRIAYFIALILAFTNLASASYISGDIYLYETGRARFDVETDVPLNFEGLNFQDNRITGTTNELTIKRGNVWTFELNSGNYSNILVDIHLPKNLDSITSIQGSENIIDIENKILSIIDSGKLQFQVSYKLKESTSYTWLLWPAILIAIIIIYTIIKKSRKRKEHLDHVFPLINDNEQKIIELLMKKPMRQKEIRKTLDFPKASFSRYLINLEKKKLIIREGEGKNKVVKLK